MSDIVCFFIRNNKFAVFHSFHIYTTRLRVVDTLFNNHHIDVDRFLEFAFDLLDNYIETCVAHIGNTCYTFNLLAVSWTWSRHNNHRVIEVWNFNTDPFLICNTFNCCIEHFWSYITSSLYCRRRRPSCSCTVLSTDCVEVVSSINRNCNFRAVRTSSQVTDN